MRGIRVPECGPPSSKTSSSASLAALGRHLNHWLRMRRDKLEVATQRSARCMMDALDWYTAHTTIVVRSGASEQRAARVSNAIRALQNKPPRHTSFAAPRAASSDAS